MTVRFRSVDDSNRGDHYHLRPEDSALYLLEFTSRQGYSFSATNQLITNLKKKPTVSAAQLNYKAQAIRTCSGGLRDALNASWLETATIVPVPGSKIAGHPDFDDRMTQVARGIAPGLNVRELVRQTVSLPSSHEAADGERLTVQDLLDVYEINEAIAEPAPVAIGILDDVLTAGTHFRAMQTVLSARYPGVPIHGLFIARRVFLAE